MAAGAVHKDGLKNLVDNYRRFGKKIWLTECHGRLRFVPALEIQEVPSGGLQGGLDCGRRVKGDCPSIKYRKSYIIVIDILKL